MFDTDQTEDPNAERIARHLAVLKELAEIGMDVARSVQRQAAENASPELGLSFTRIARAVRQTLALETRVAEDGLAWERDLARAQQAEQQRRAGEADTQAIIRRSHGESGKALVRDIVAETIQIEAEETERPEGVERLLADLHERLEDYDLLEDYADRSIGEMVAKICKALGVTVDWNLHSEDVWARHEIATRPPRSPYANGVPKPIWPPRPDDDPPLKYGGPPRPPPH